MAARCAAKGRVPRLCMHQDLANIRLELLPDRQRSEGCFVLETSHPDCKEPHSLPRFGWGFATGAQAARHQGLGKLAARHEEISRMPIDESTWTLGVQHD